MAKYQEKIGIYGCPLLSGIVMGIPNTPDATTPHMALLDTGSYHTLIGEGIADLLGVIRNANAS